MPIELELSVFLLLELAASVYQLNEALGFLACTKICDFLNLLTILTIQAYLCLLHQVLKLSTIVFFHFGISIFTKCAFRSFIRLSFVEYNKLMKTWI